MRPWVAARPRAVRAACCCLLPRWCSGRRRASTETAIAFAGADGASIETVIAFAGAGRASTETAIAFAGAKWAFLVQFSGAEVMPVSEVPCWGRAVVLLVSTSPRCLASCAKNFALLGLMCARARKSSPCALTMAQNWRFLACWASFFAEEPLEGRCWASFFRANRPCAGLGCSAVHFRLAADGGFAPLGARWRRVAGVSGF